MKIIKLPILTVALMMATTSNASNKHWFFDQCFQAKPYLEVAQKLHDAIIKCDGEAMLSLISDEERKVTKATAESLSKMARKFVVNKLFSYKFDKFESEMFLTQQHQLSVGAFYINKSELRSGINLTIEKLPEGIKARSITFSLMSPMLIEAANLSRPRAEGVAKLALWERVIRKALPELTATGVEGTFILNRNTKKGYVRTWQKWVEYCDYHVTRVIEGRPIDRTVVF